MVQGKVKHKSLPDDIKKNLSAKTKKTKASIGKKKNNNTIEKIVKQKLDGSMKNKIESDLTRQAKSAEGKSFHLLK